MTTWHNWAGNQSCTPSGVEHPRDVGEVVDVVKRAADRGGRVKAIGAGHSFTGIGVTDGTQLHLGALSGVIHADAVTGRVLVRAGTALHELNAALWELGLALPNLGDIDRQSIAGALATGTHGTGHARFGIAAAVTGLELVLADGSVLTCSATEHPELFQSARIGLGAFGVLTAVELQCVPRFALRAHEEPDRLGAVLERFPQWVTEHDHVELYWFPHTDRVLTKRNDVVAPDALEPLPRWKGWVDDELLSNKVFGATCALGARVPALIPRINAVAARALSARTYTDRSYRVFCSPRSVRFVEMEYALPRTSLPSVLREVDRFVKSSGLRISFPVEVRVTAADDVWMSTSYGRASAYLAVHVHKGTPYEEYFAGVEAIATAAGGRPHWGKMHSLGAEQLRPRYEHFDEVVAQRRAVDPGGVFSNDYLDRVLGGVS
jgi:FAD-linked oxidoreductase